MIRCEATTGPGSGFTDAVSSVLLVGGGGDGVAVVAAEEDQRALERG